MSKSWIIKMFTKNTFTKCVNSKLTKENSVSKSTSKAQKNTAIYKETPMCRMVQNSEGMWNFEKSICVYGIGRKDGEVMVRDEARNAGWLIMKR